MTDPHIQAILQITGNQHLLLKKVVAKLNRLISIEYIKLTPEQKKDLARLELDKMQKGAAKSKT